MTISNRDIKMLWGRAGGRCSKPSCDSDLTIIVDELSSYTVGEMAHVIARSNTGPRGVSTGGDDSYANLILLCPTCRTHIDKAPSGVYTVDTLHSWKEAQEKKIKQAGVERNFESVNDLKSEIRYLLFENRGIWENFGPKSKIALTDLGSNAHEIWSARKLDTVIPNNINIINLIESNRAILSEAEYLAFLEFKIHARAFESHQYSRVDYYPTFPVIFYEIFAA